MKLISTEVALEWFLQNQLQGCKIVTILKNVARIKKKQN